MTSELALVELVAAARLGEGGAWAALVERFQDLAVAVAVGILADPTAAEDAAQEAFVLAATHIGDLRDPAAFPAWFSRLVRTACARRIRATRTAEPLVEQAGPDSADPAEVVAGKAERGRLRSAVEALPNHERVVVALHYLGGLSYPETADFLGLRVHGSKARLLGPRPTEGDLPNDCRCPHPGSPVTNSTIPQLRDAVSGHSPQRPRGRVRIARC